MSKGLLSNNAIVMQTIVMEPRASHNAGWGWGGAGLKYPPRVLGVKPVITRIMPRAPARDGCRCNLCNMLLHHWMHYRRRLRYIQWHIRWLHLCADHLTLQINALYREEWRLWFLSQPVEEQYRLLRLRWGSWVAMRLQAGLLVDY